MSEHEHKQHTPAVAIPTSITRKNDAGEDVTVTCAVGEFGKQSKDNAGKKYYYPPVNKTNLETMISFMGSTFVAEELDRLTKKIFSGIYLDNWNKETGKLDQESWLKDATDFTEGVDTASALKEDKIAIQDQITAIIDSDEYVAPNEGEEPTTRFVELQAQVMELNKQIGPIKRRLAKLEQKNADKTAKRLATKAANEAAAAAKPRTEAVAA